MVNSISAYGPFVQPHTHAYGTGEAAPTDDESKSVDLSRRSVAQGDAERRGENGNRHGGRPGQLGKDLLDDRSQRSLLGTLVSLIAQGQFEEAERLVAELTSREDASPDGAKRERRAGDIGVHRYRGNGSGSGSDGRSHGGSGHRGLRGSGSRFGHNRFSSDYLNGRGLTVETLTSPNGTIVDNGDGTFTFTPNENFNGEATLNFKVSDGTATVELTATVGIAPVNDAPVISSPLAGREDEPLTVRHQNIWDY